MNRSRSTTLLSITLGAILFTGAIVPILSQQAFAQADTQDNLILPPWGNPVTTPNAVLIDLTDDNFASDANPSCLTTQAAGTFLLQNQIVGPTPFQLHPVVPGVATNPTGATVAIPNLIDPLLEKNLMIEIAFCPTGSITAPPPVVSGITCKDATTGDTVGQFVSTTGPLQGESGQTPGSVYIKEFWDCFPNPDWEQIELNYNSDWILIQAAVNTISTIDPDPPVGGTFEGVNTASLLVAGAQANALWLIPLITAIGIGIVIVNRKRFF